MPDPQSTRRLDQLEEEIAAMRERIGRYRRAMIGSRVAAVGGLCTLLIVYTLLPRFGSTAVVLGAIVCAIGGTVWLGATKSSMEELTAAVARAEAEKGALFDDVAVRNGWLDASLSSSPAADRRRRPFSR